MNLDELQSVQARERQSSDLQHLRSSFYREVGEFINELNEERARVVEAADDPFAEPEVRQLTDDIETAEATVEAIYERRVGKVVKKASIAAAGMPVENEGLTDEERKLFEDLVDRIEANRESVLSVLDGKEPSVSCSIDTEIDPENTGRNGEVGPEAPTANHETTPAGTQPEDGVSAADLMGNGGETAAAESDGLSRDTEIATDATPEAESGPTSEPEVESGSETPPDSQSRSDPQPRETEPGSSTTATGSTTGTGTIEEPPGAETATESKSAAESSPTTGSGSKIESNNTAEPGSTSRAKTESGSSDRTPGMPRTTVRITANVGEIVGADGRDYDLGDEDVVTLPDPNAETLVEKNAAQRLE